MRFSGKVGKAMKKLILFLLTPRFAIFGMMLGALSYGGVLDKTFGSFATVVVMGIFADMLKKKQES